MALQEKIAALLSDLGKLTVPVEILPKRRQFEQTVLELIKFHLIIG